MSALPKVVHFAAAGQVVIPEEVCREFHIENGTPVTVESTPQGILLKPEHASEPLRGILAPQPGDRPFAEEWAEHKAEELALEEAKYERRTRGSR